MVVKHDNTNVMSFVTFASTGDGQDFGDMPYLGWATGVTNGTRGIIGGILFSGSGGRYIKLDLTTSI